MHCFLRVQYDTSCWDGAQRRAYSIPLAYGVMGYGSTGVCIRLNSLPVLSFVSKVRHAWRPAFTRLCSFNTESEMKVGLGLDIIS